MKYPLHIYGGAWNTPHVQGIAIDTAREYMYFSFTTALVKTTLNGEIIGSVGRLTGHLGDLDFNDRDGRVYGSLEYKKAEAFYIAIFDVKKIDRLDMDAERDGIMTVVYLPEVVRDFTADMDDNGVFDGDTADTADHRYGCSGIDGVAFGPAFGSPKNSEEQLMIAYGIYGNQNRTDNDYQVILQYDPDDLKKYELPLNQSSPHTSGPDKPAGKYFIFTGNTVFGVQNLEYDAYSGLWFMAVYRGQKSCYPNYPMFIIDGSSVPRSDLIRGQAVPEYGMVLPLSEIGLYHIESGVHGIDFPYGQTGLAALDDGYFYVSLNDKTDDNKQTSDVYLYKWNGAGFDRVVFC